MGVEDRRVQEEKRAHAEPSALKGHKVCEEIRAHVELQGLEEHKACRAHVDPLVLRGRADNGARRAIAVFRVKMRFSLHASFNNLANVGHDSGLTATPMVSLMTYDVRAVDGVQLPTYRLL